MDLALSLVLVRIDIYSHDAVDTFSSSCGLVVCRQADVAELFSSKRFQLVVQHSMVYDALISGSDPSRR